MSVEVGEVRSVLAAHARPSSVCFAALCELFPSAAQISPQVDAYVTQALRRWPADVAREVPQHWLEALYDRNDTGVALAWCDTLRMRQIGTWPARAFHRLREVNQFEGLSRCVIEDTRALTHITGATWAASLKELCFEGATLHEGVWRALASGEALDGVRSLMFRACTVHVYEWPISPLDSFSRAPVYVWHEIMGESALLRDVQRLVIDQVESREFDFVGELLETCARSLKILSLKDNVFASRSAVDRWVEVLGKGELSELYLEGMRSPSWFRGVCGGLRRAACRGVALDEQELGRWWSREMPHLESLDLRGSQIGEEGVALLAERCRGWRLQELGLSHTGVWGSRCAELLAKSAGLWGLRRLELAGVSLRDEGVMELAMAPWAMNLEALDISHNDVGEEALDLVLDGQDFGELTELVALPNPVGVRGVLGLFAGGYLEGQEALDLTACGLDDTALNACIEYGVFRYLKGLDLSDNSLTCAGVEAVLRATRIERLSLSGLMLGDVGVLALAVRAGVRWLDMRSTGVGVQSLYELEKVEGGVLEALRLDGAVLRGEGMRALWRWEGARGLRLLSLERCVLGEEGVIALAEGLRAARALREVRVHDVVASREAWRRFDEAARRWPELRVEGRDLGMDVFGME